MLASECDACLALSWKLPLIGESLHVLGEDSAKQAKFALASTQWVYAPSACCRGVSIHGTEC